LVLSFFVSFCGAFCRFVILGFLFFPMPHFPKTFGAPLCVFYRPVPTQ
jgi:hypothetical protein